MLYVAALLVVIALIVVALWLSGLLSTKAAAGQKPARINPSVSIIGVGLIAFAVGFFTGWSRPKDAEPLAGMASNDKEPAALVSRANPEGILGTMVKPPVKSGSPDAGGQPGSGGDLAAMTQRLEKKMAGDPKNGDGWQLLARAYLEMRQHGKAVEAFAKAAALLPPDATMLADWADAYVVAHDRKWDETSRNIVKRALAADKKHIKALSLAGSEAFDRGNYQAAINYWKRMKEVAPADSMSAKLADSNITEANALLKAGKR